MYDIKPSIIIGFHGCDLEVRNKLVNNPSGVEISRKPYDWLGHGLYFWENNYTRAMEWAHDKKRAGKIDNPAVLGAVLQLGYCCDFLDSKFIHLIKRHYESMRAVYESAGKSLPENSDSPGDVYHDKLIRKLDCTVIEYMHQKILEQHNKDISANKFSNTQVFDSTRGIFTEGGPAFQGASLYAKSHIQVCIRNMNCIKGLFIPREEVTFP
jgi:hypothetical protein